MKSTWIHHHLGLEIAAADCSKSRCEPRIGAANYRRMGQQLGYADTLECPPLEGAKEGLVRLAGHFAIHVYTARPEEKTHWARLWFAQQGLGDAIEAVISTHSRSKAALAAACASHALVDNDIRHLREPTPYTTRRILFSPAGDGLERMAGVATVASWRELVAMLLSGREQAA